MTYNIKLYRDFPLSRRNNYVFERGLSSIYYDGMYVLDGENVSGISPYATYTGFAPFNLDLSISIVLPSVSSDSKNVFGGDELGSKSINYMIVEVKNDSDSSIQHIGYFITSQFRLANSTIRVTAEADVLNSIDFSDLIDFKQSIFTRRHKSRVKSISLPPPGSEEDVINTLNPIDVFPESYNVPQSISRKTEIDPDRGLNFSMIQRAINETSGDDVVASHPSWGIVLEPSKLDGDEITGAYVNRIGFSNKVLIGSSTRGVLSLGLTSKLRQSETVSRYVRIPYFPFDLSVNKIVINGTDPEEEFYTRIIASMRIEIPADAYGANLKSFPQIIKQEPNAYTHVSLTNFTDFYTQTEYDALSSSERASNDEILSHSGYMRDAAYFDYEGMLGIIDKEDQHPSSNWLKRELQTIAPLADNLAVGLRKLIRIPYDDRDELVFPKANQIIDPKINHSSLSPITLVFGSDFCDVPLETFDNICNDDRITVNISYSLATPGNFTLYVLPKTGGFVETTEFYPCTFSVYPAADMQLTSTAYVAYMRDQRPFDLNIQANNRQLLSYTLGMKMVGETFNEAMSPSGVASYGGTALVKMGVGMMNTIAYLTTYDALYEQINAKKQAVSLNSSTPLVNTTYDIWQGISNYHAWVIEKEPKPYFKDEILKDFFYHGYSTMERLPSLVQTRWLFDFFQGSIVVKPSANGAVADRLVSLFNEGITILHGLPQHEQFEQCNYAIPNYDDGYENLERVIPDAL